MRKFYTHFTKGVMGFLLLLTCQYSNSQVIISQYYEGASGTNSWIELTNLGNTSVNTASPQLKLGIWLRSGSNGDISFNGAASSTYNLNLVIPAKGTVLIGNSNNGTEVPYLSAASAHAVSNSVIKFNGNDGIALLNSSNGIIDRFGNGINAANISYVRKATVTAANSGFSSSEWTNTTLSAVQTAAIATAPRLGYHTAPACIVPAAQATGLLFSGVTQNSANGSFNASAASGFLVVRSLNSSLSTNPSDGTSYITGAALGGGTVVSEGTSTSFSSPLLNPSSTYYYFVYAYNNSGCSGGPKYLTVNPLTGAVTTLAPPCLAPVSQPSALNFNSVTASSVSGSFTASGAGGYLVLRTASALAPNPINGVLYVAGDTIGNASVVSAGSSTSFISAGLQSNSNYSFYVFAYNNSNCTGGPIYQTVSPLNAAVTTLNPACAVPAAQPTSLIFTTVTINSVDGSFTGSGADGYLVLQNTASTLSVLPSNGIVYTAGSLLGTALVLATGNSTSFSSTGLTAGTGYYYFVFAYNDLNCSGGINYLGNNPLSGQQTTATVACQVPATQPNALVFNGINSNNINGSFAASGADKYLVVQSTDTVLTGVPQNGTHYVPGSLIGNGQVIKSSVFTSFSSTGLAAGTTYYYNVFAYNDSNCTGGPVYLTTAPLMGNSITDAAGYNYYFGNLHSHSSYSDGNADNTVKIPADDYEFAKTAMCMDFLGISEHNHLTAGMHLADWQPLMAQANAATTPNFVGLYGMEWGVIGNTGATGDNAGHLLVYGVDSLIGWEAGNYDVFVPKSTYTGPGGLFEVINRNSSNYAFATLAHPDNYDYDNLLNTNYDLLADNAIVGTALENGPAFSTDTTYSNPATSMNKLNFYRSMLAKGYHLGATIDHDNHNMTFGKTAKTRLAVLASSLSKQNIFEAMRSMRFYATQDCNARINFTVNAEPMGSIITKSGAPEIFVSCITTNAVSSIKIMYGVPGSGIAAVILSSNSNTSSLSYTDVALANLATGYYYADITETTGERIISSPIWYTRDDNALRPAFITSLFTVNESNRVLLKWTVANEPDGENYEIQRSVDGRNFTTIAHTIAGRNLPTYAVADNNPVNGLAWYRLIHKSAQGNYSSELKMVNRAAVAADYLTAYPNPVSSILTIRIASVKNENTQLQLFDMAGRLIKSVPVALVTGEQTLQTSVAKLSKGTYILKMRIAQKLHTQMVSKL